MAARMLEPPLLPLRSPKPAKWFGRREAASPWTSPSSFTHRHCGHSSGPLSMLLLSPAIAARSRLRREPPPHLRASERPVSSAPPGFQGAKPRPLLACLLLGLLLRFALPVPAGLTPQGWTMLAVFAGTVAGIVTSPLPAPGVALCGLTLALLSGAVGFGDGVSAFADEVVWLVFLAFFFAKGFAKTGLGDRLAFGVVRLAGNTTLGLAYGLIFAEAILAAGMPSSAARAAGIFYPVTVSVAKASGSDPELGTEKKTGRFLLQSVFQSTGCSATLWFTGTAQNMLVLSMARQLGLEFPSPFRTWLLAASVPALACMLLTPLVAYVAVPPEVRRTPEAPEVARRKLREMGPMSRDETVMAATVLGMVVLWAGGSAWGVPSVVTALLGLCVLQLCGTVTWADCLEDRGAWSTFVWFAILVSMSAALNKLGVVKWLAAGLSAWLAGLGLGPTAAFSLLLLAYYLSHYAFASQVAHIGALYQPFLAMMVSAGTPPIVAVVALAAASNLFAGLTPYASAQAPVFFGGGYITEGEWYRCGFLFMTFNLLIWILLGGAWWRLLGLY